MTKQEFLCELEGRLSGLPRQEVQERLGFYSEMIDDRMEEGSSEEEAVLEIGSVHEIASQIIADIPLAKMAKERLKATRRPRAWETVLLILGSPIWFSLGLAVFAVIFSLYVSLWSVIVSLWAVFISLCACAVGTAAAGIFFVCRGSGLDGVALIGAGFFCAGAAIFWFFGCRAATKGIILLTQKTVSGIKKCFVKKEGTV